MVRPQSMQKPTLVHAIGPPPPPTTFRTITSTSPTPMPPKSDTALQATTTECPPNSSMAISSVTSTKSINGNNLLKRLASSHYQSYTTALTVTIAVGCFLLLLNILIFAGIYHQRDRGRNTFGDKKKEELAEAGSCSSSSGEGYETKSMSSQYEPRKYDCKSSYELSRVGSFKCESSNYGECKSSNYVSVAEYSYEKRPLEPQLSELPLQEFKSSPPGGVKRIEGQIVRPPSYSSDVPASDKGGDEQKLATSPNIPEPPPPPKSQAPTVTNQTGILRGQNAPTTPGTMKKRVQIQEISV